MPKRLPMQVIKIKNYGDDWINRLAVVMITMGKMEHDERSACLKFMKSKYSIDWPNDSD